MAMSMSTLNDAGGLTALLATDSPATPLTHGCCCILMVYSRICMGRAPQVKQAVIYCVPFIVMACTLLCVGDIADVCLYRHLSQHWGLCSI